MFQDILILPSEIIFFIRFERLLRNIAVRSYKRYMVKLKELLFPQAYHEY